MRRAAYLGIGAISGFAVTTALPFSESLAYEQPSDQSHSAGSLPTPRPPSLPSRHEHLNHLASHGSINNPYDILVIGGGATGTGCALDAVTRGLSVALIEREDFAAGTSSRSTKLVHGGVRYLEKAVKNLDYGQLKLVFEALHERKTVLDIAPHLATSLPIMTPCYSWWEVPYYWAGMKAYDLVAGARALSWSHFESAGKSKATFPTLCNHRKDGKTLKGSIVYYDGQFNDSRLAVALACTAAQSGATVVNHAEVVRLIQEESQAAAAYSDINPTTQKRVIGAVVKDNLTNKEYPVYARTVVNATGPFADSIRHLSDPNAKPMIMPSAGVHVTLPDYYSPENLGMIVPKTKDGRVVFMLPWLGETIAGTTDSGSEITMRPQPTEEEIQFILDAIGEYLTVKVRRGDVKSAWSGIRPLAIDPHAKDTASALRDHVVSISPDSLITITGGKWTTYRLMAQDAIDAAARVGNLNARPCVTERVPLIGAVGWHPALFTEVAQNYIVPHRPGAIDTRVAKYLASAYGDRAREITRLAEEYKLGKRLVRGYPVIEAEVIYCSRYEYCETPEDFVARRTRLAFLDRVACLEALPRVVELLAREKGWGRRKSNEEYNRAKEFLDTFEASYTKGGPKSGVESRAKGESAPAVGAVDSSAQAAAA